MPSHSRNMPEQEHSIKARSHELFVDPSQATDGKATKPFPVYLRETPARPMSVFTKAIFWLVGIIVGVLFLAAVWRIGHHQRSPGPNRRTVSKTVMALPPDRVERRTRFRLYGQRVETSRISPTFGTRNYTG
jgi:hypothetical protein